MQADALHHVDKRIKMRRIMGQKNQGIFSIEK